MNCTFVDNDLVLWMIMVTFLLFCWYSYVHTEDRVLMFSLPGALAIARVDFKFPNPGILCA